MKSQSYLHITLQAERHDFPVTVLNIHHVEYATVFSVLKTGYLRNVIPFYLESGWYWKEANLNYILPALRMHSQQEISSKSGQNPVQ